MKITVLGSGTSTGVPVAGGNSPVGDSKDPRDQRLRSSILIEKEGCHIVIDTGPDFRRQMLDASVDSLDAILYTHGHYDHVGGLDDLRAYSFHDKKGLDLYFSRPCYERVNLLYEHIGASSRYYGKPNLNFHILEHDPNGIYHDLSIGPLHIQPLELLHVEEPELISTGYLIDSVFAYLTDFKHVLDPYLPLLEKVDTVIAGAPLPWPHPNHISIPDAVSLMQNLGVRQGYITHLSDKKFHEELLRELPENIQPAYDGMTLEF